MTHEPSQWENILAENPQHSAWYIQRFRDMAAAGDDIVGEARLIDAMVPRRAQILDAGCGPGRLAGYLHGCGHTVVGYDLDPALIAAAQEDYPGPTWLVGNLADLDLAAQGITAPCDAIVCAGNVMTFVAPSTRQEILRRFRAHLAPTGRAVIGFGANRGYAFAEFFADAEAVGLRTSLSLATWDARPLTPSSDFLVAVLERDDAVAA